MNMDRTMVRVRVRTQSLANDTWAGPWYEYEDEDEYARKRIANGTWAGPWYESVDEDEDTHT